MNASFDTVVRLLTEAHHRELAEQAIQHAAEVGRLKAKIADLESRAPEIIKIGLAFGLGAATAKPDADGWIAHDGTGLPVFPDAFVQIRTRGGAESTPSSAGQWEWVHGEIPWVGDIVAYRVCSPQPAVTGIDSEGGSHD